MCEHCQSSGSSHQSAACHPLQGRAVASGGRRAQQGDESIEGVCNFVKFTLWCGIPLIVGNGG